ncbi:MAG: recombination-associated protein RdgC [Planctomycetota bacterium]
MLRLRSQSVRRFRVVGPLPSPYEPAFAERLHDRRFRPLAPHEERTYGWVTADNLLVTRFDVDTLVRGETVAFALRIDQRRVPPRLLKAHLELELDARTKAAGDGGRPGRISREERKALREEITRRLLLETPPHVQAHGILLDPRRRVLYVQSLSRRVLEQVQLLVADTFEVSLEALTPWRRAQEIVAGTEAMAALEDIRRTELGGASEALAAALARRVRGTAAVTEEVPS